MQEEIPTQWSHDSVGVRGEDELWQMPGSAEGVAALANSDLVHWVVGSCGYVKLIGRIVDFIDVPKGVRVFVVPHSGMRSMLAGICHRTVWDEGLRVDSFVIAMDWASRLRRADKGEPAIVSYFVAS